MTPAQQREVTRRQGGAYFFTPAEIRAEIAATERRLEALRQSLGQALMSEQVQEAMK